MQVNDNYMDELFSRKLGNMEVAPPEDGWIRIENELNRRKGVTRKFWLAAASFALILSVTATVVYIQTGLLTNPSATVAAIDESTTQHTEIQPLALGYEQEVNLQNNPVENEMAIAATATATASNTQIAAHDESAVLVVREDPIAFTNIQHENEPSDIPVYTDSWNEILRAKPIQLNQRQIAKLKINQQKEEPIVIASTTIPRYDEIAYADATYTATRSKPNNRWEMTGQFAPMYSYRAISSVPSGVRMSDFDDAESPLLAYSGGITLSYRVYGRLSIQTGVFYSQMGQSINNIIPVTNMYAAASSNNLYNKNFVRTSTGNVAVASNLKSDANSNYSNFFSSESSASGANPMSAANISGPAKYRLIERIDYLEIPLVLRYRIVDRKFIFYVLSGMSANILVNNNVFFDNGSEIIKSGAIMMTRPVNYNSLFGLGLGYHINQKLSVEFEPSFKYYLQSYTTSSLISTNPYAFGVFTGMVYRF